ncbi:MAG: hypothetical protein WBB48_13620 [Thermodesulfobacteriota bacterium]
MAKIIIETTEENIRIFADRFFDKKYEFTKRDDDEIEITQKDPDIETDADDHGLRH